ncbi:putative pf02656 domain protein [Erysiphe necator]|uniref:Putative pf02656 domain protein n=1 Tax=Uncinula necator TaxID=52586 RepID=A0A0B1P8Y0_UNCNE|nr:putative pf02656 domain protein [Erysiphe necator]
MQQDRKSLMQSNVRKNVVAVAGCLDAEGHADGVTKAVDTESVLVCNETREEDIADIKRNKNASKYTRWWACLCTVGKNYQSISLENKGSVARDHLALGMKHRFLFDNLCFISDTESKVRFEKLDIIGLFHYTERTFLAWLRTSLAFASIGIAITQLFRLSSMRSKNIANDNRETILILNDASQQIRRLGKPLGTTFIGISTITLLLGSNRYFECQKWIIRGKFPACRGSITVMVIATLALMITSLFVILLEPSK